MTRTTLLMNTIK